MCRVLQCQTAVLDELFGNPHEVSAIYLSSAPEVGRALGVVC